MTAKQMDKTVFLDRDGVINRDSPAYIKSWEEFTFLPGSLDALRELNKNGYRVILITNQSAVGRGMITSAGLNHMHQMMKDEIVSHGGLVSDIFFCPHMPDKGCDCRKPAPGMILQAREKYHIDLSQAVMVGDSAKDIECAGNAGCSRAVLVKTGNGRQAEKQLIKKGIFPDYVAADLFNAAQWIMGKL